MRATHLLVSILFGLAPLSAMGFETSPSWGTNVKAAQEQASRTNRLVLVHCWTPSCGPCRAMEQTVFADPNVTHSLSQHYVPVKLNLQDDPDFGQKYGIKTIPTDVVISPDGTMIEMVNSPRTPETYVSKFTQVALAAATQPVSTPAPASELAQNGAAGPAAVASNGAGAAASPGLVGDRYKDHPLVNGFAGRYGNEAVEGPPQFGTPQGTPSQGEPSIPDYRQHGNLSQPVYAGQTSGPASPTMTPPVANPAPSLGNPAQPVGNPAQPVANSPQNPAVGASPAAPVSAAISNPHNIQLPPGVPPLAFDGYCTVTVRDQESWQLGNSAWGVIHRGQTYLFATQQAQQAFQSKPDFYGMVLGGHDVIHYLETGQMVPGSREHGATYKSGGVFLFANEANLKRFQDEPIGFINRLQQVQKTAASQPQR